MTDDFTILSDAELDQVSGGDNPYAPSHRPPGHHDRVNWGELGALPSYRSITPFSAGWTSAWAANA
jgi:bacteriocin-like protein